MPTLYYSPPSPPCLSVRLAAKVLDIHLDLKLIDSSKGENKTPEFLKLNPQHTIPTLEDDGFSVWESRAIVTYLVNKYGKGSSLYPEDPKARALIDQRLYFDIGTLYSRFIDYLIHLMSGAPEDGQKRSKLEEALKFLDQFLEGQTFVAGDNLTVADICIVASVAAIIAFDGDFNKNANVKRWFEMIQKTTPGYKETVQTGADIFKELVNNMLNKSKN